MNIICIPALKKHKEHLNLSLKYLANHYSINEIISLFGIFLEIVILFIHGNLVLISSIKF